MGNAIELGFGKPARTIYDAAVGDPAMMAQVERWSKELEEAGDSPKTRREMLADVRRKALLETARSRKNMRSVNELGEDVGELIDDSVRQTRRSGLRKIKPKGSMSSRVAQYGNEALSPNIKKIPKGYKLEGGKLVPKRQGRLITQFLRQLFNDN